MSATSHLHEVMFQVFNVLWGRGRGRASNGASGNLESDYKRFDLIYTKTRGKDSRNSSLLERLLHEQRSLVTLHDARRSVSVHRRSLHFHTFPVSFFCPHLRYFLF